jgi:DNA (cytosine-5)-methyltransferase 1
MTRITRTPTVAGAPKASDEWRTPQALYDALDAEFGFHVDLAANAENALHQIYLGPGGVEDDSLVASWHEVASVGYLNPPYSAALIGRFVKKAAQEAQHGFTTVMLVKHDPSTRWWEWTRSAVEIREVQGRVPFVTADGVTKAGAMFPSAVVVFRPQPGIVRGQPRRVVWTYRLPKGPA